ncbi:inositol-3-phosphate synthase [Brevibacillus laterosporus]|uniref:Inositol-3-phosphate synthase n=1 Tax=Brevibacillus laterosporus LMG 15441 TaxID=1042163 RepID=A0A075R457_BRELA|nr:inositol-3-phosphate synthase [Brevibacillus laterosporus]AIG26639.1 inositol-3-phosphate synthase [Brevibacillus laterosporus LMG 15441]
MTYQTGVLFVGMLGAVATTTISGLFAVNQNLAPLRGVISSEKEFETLQLTPLDQIAFGGWDIQKDSLIEAVKRHGIIQEPILQKIEMNLNDVPVWQAPLANVNDFVKGVYKLKGEPETLESAVDKIQEDIEAFRKKYDLERIVVINTASTEEKTKTHSLYQSLKAFETGLKENSPDIRPGMLYAYAAMKAKCAYVNFTPSVTSEIPALQKLAETQGVPTAGKDGRTGQTLYKHVLGKMFKQRGLNIVGWYSTNILGNQDGAILDHPRHSSTKIDSKSIGLERILGYSHFDHKVRIDYFPVRGDRKEAWDTVDFEGWLGERMTMKINWLGIDSILAAPLIIDLSRFMDHALQKGKTGIMEHLSLFFKSPIGTDEYALDQQYQMLLKYVKHFEYNA